MRSEERESAGGPIPAAFAMAVATAIASEPAPAPARVPEPGGAAAVPGLSEAEVQDSLRHSVKDGCAHAFMLGCGEAYFSPYAIFLGAGSVLVGVIASVPLLVGSLAQVVAVIGGPPEYIAANWDRLVGTAQHLAELKAAAG